MYQKSREYTIRANDLRQKYSYKIFAPKWYLRPALLISLYFPLKKMTLESFPEDDEYDSICHTFSDLLGVTLKLFS